MTTLPTPSPVSSSQSSLSAAASAASSASSAATPMNKALVVTVEKPNRSKLLGWLLLPLLLATVYRSFLYNPLRTLYSLRKVSPDTNIYVMDYYCNYNLQHIRKHGIHGTNIEDTFIDLFFPKLVANMAKKIKRHYVPREIHSTNKDDEHHCSTVSLQSHGGAVYFGRNFDWYHDASLVLRVHDDQGLASVAVIDLHYLNLNRPNVHETWLIERIPLLFSPYYVMDGMNRYGVAVSEMTVPYAKAPYSKTKPTVIYPTLLRIILDTAQTTQQAIDRLHEFRIVFPYTYIHFMFSDKSGDARIVEFVDGKIRVTSSNASPWQVCTNFVVYNKSERQKDRSCRRYQIGSDQAEQLLGTHQQKSIDVIDAIKVTRSMAVKGWTMYTTIYELQSGTFRIFYKTQPGFGYRDSIPQVAIDV